MKLNAIFILFFVVVLNVNSALGDEVCAYSSSDSENISLPFNPEYGLNLYKYKARLDELESICENAKGVEELRIEQSKNKLKNELILNQFFLDCYEEVADKLRENVGQSWIVPKCENTNSLIYGEGKFCEGEAHSNGMSGKYSFYIYKSKCRIKSLKTWDWF